MLSCTHNGTSFIFSGHGAEYLRLEMVLSFLNFVPIGVINDKPAWGYKCLGTKLATSHYLTSWCLGYRCFIHICVSLGLKELNSFIIVITDKQLYSKDLNSWKYLSKMISHLVDVNYKSGLLQLIARFHAKNLMWLKCMLFRNKIWLLLGAIPWKWLSDHCLTIDTKPRHANSQHQIGSSSV